MISHRRYISVFLFFILTTSACKLLQRINNPIWEAIPPTAFAVVELPQGLAALNDAKNDPLLNKIFLLDFSNKLKNSISAIDSLKLFTGLGKVDNIPLTLSAHLSGGEQYDFICYLPNFLKKGYASLYNWKEILNTKGWIIKENTFRGNDVYQILDKSSSVVFSIYVFDKYLAISNKPFLIEEAANQWDKGNNDLANAIFQGLNHKSLKQSSIKLFMPSSNLFYLNTLFYENESPSATFIDDAMKFSTSYSIGFNPSDKKNPIQGICSEVKTMSNVFSKHRNILPTYKNYLPVKYLVGGAEETQNFEKFYKQWRTKKDTIIDHYYLPWIGDRWTWYYTGAIAPGEPNVPIFVFESKDDTKANTMLSLLGDRQGVSDQAIKYGKTKIKKIKDPYLIKRLYPAMHPGDQVAAYFANPAKGIVAMSYDPILLQNAIIHLSNNALHKDKEKKLTTMPIPANQMNLFMQPGYGRNIVGKGANTRFSSYLNDIFTQLSGVGGFDITLTNESDHLLFSLHKNLQENVHTGVLWETALQGKPITEPSVVYNCNNNEQEILIQDELYILYVIDKMGKIKHQVQLESEILSPIYDINSNNSNWPIYVFNTNNYFYFLERKEDEIANVSLQIPFPTDLSLTKVERMDNDPFFIMSARNNTVYSYNAHGFAVKGWSSKKFDSKILFPAASLMSQDKSYIGLYDSEKNFSIYDDAGRFVAKWDVIGSLSEPPIGISNRGRGFFLLQLSSGKTMKCYVDGIVEIKSYALSNSSQELVKYNANNDIDEEWAIRSGNDLALYSSIYKTGELRLPCAPDTTYSVAIDYNNTQGIATLCKTQKQGYLWTTKGKLSSGFPINTDAAFATANLLDDGGLTVIGIGENNTLYAIKLK